MELLQDYSDYMIYRLVTEILIHQHQIIRKKVMIPQMVIIIIVVYQVNKIIICKIQVIVIQIIISIII